MNKVRKCCYFISLFMISSIPLSCANAMRSSRSSEDPLLHLNYAKAFDQTAVYRRHKKVMDDLGCTKNISTKSTISSQNKPTLNNQVPLYTPPPVSQELIYLPGRVVAIEINPPTFDTSPEWACYKNDCLSQLQNARNSAILEPARQASITMALLGGATTSVVSVLGFHSFGGDIMLSASFFNSVYLMQDITSSLYYRYVTPTHPLDELEKDFAIKKCFIPKDLWPALITHFMTARQNPFAQQKSISFIEFTLGLTTYYPKPSISLQTNSKQVMDNFSSLIDEFFEKYADFSSIDEYGTLKTNVLKFVLSFFRQEMLSRYIYLQGPGGIGKTHFTQQLSKWLNASMEDSVHVENLIITSSNELEGSEEKPGAFLRVLRNQSLAKKFGSVVFMDEASWLNKDDMISPAKRVFNGQLSKISSTYFGSGVEGAGIDLTIPPMLIILAGNAPIGDEALRSRFDVINFPMPTKKALLAYAKTVLADHLIKLGLGNNTRIALSSSSSLSSPAISSSSISLQITEEDLADCKTFRDVESLVPALVGKSYFPLRRRQIEKITS